MAGRGGKRIYLYLRKTKDALQYREILGVDDGPRRAGERVAEVVTKGHGVHVNGAVFGEREGENVLFAGLGDRGID